MNYRRGFWLYPLFQIPLMFLGTFLTIALLFWLFNFGKPPVAVAIALDLSSSTYGAVFNEPGSVMAQEIQAVEAYLAKNSSRALREPNQVQIFGFASRVQELTSTFQTDSEQISRELNQALQPSLPNIIGGGTDLDFAIQKGTEALSPITKRCKELLLVTDGEASVDDQVININNAQNKKVKINAIIIGADAPAIQTAALNTGGTYLSGDITKLESLFTDKFFNSFNSNQKWIIFWLACAWVALMWTIIMPLDRWIFQGLLRMPINLAGRLALGNALFWTAATPGILWRLYQILNLSLPFLSSC